MTNQDWMAIVPLGFILAVAGLHDAADRRVPNRLIYVGLLVGVLVNIMSNASPDHLVFGVFRGLGVALAGTITGLLLLLPLYMLRAMGAGDVKLMAVVGSFLGAVEVSGAVLLTFLAGGVLALLTALLSHSLPQVLTNLRFLGLTAISGRASGMSMRDIQTTGRLPYAVAIAAGTALQLWLAARGGWPFV